MLLAYSLWGLKAEIGYAVRMFKPTSLSDAFCLAKLQEANNSVTRGRPTPVQTVSKNVVSTPYNRGGGSVSKNVVTMHYAPGHKCSGQLFSLEVVGEGMVMEEDDDLQLNEEGVMSTYTTSLIDEPPLISLNALTGKNSYRTMRVRAYVGKNVVHTLVDCGSTHNFLDLNTTNEYLAVRWYWASNGCQHWDGLGKPKQGKKFMTAELSVMGVCVCLATFMNIEAENSHSTNVKIVLEEFN
ncbi:hypothetical protein Tco_1270089 [Tanacetum coccineum]